MKKFILASLAAAAVIAPHRPHRWLGQRRHHGRQRRRHRQQGRDHGPVPRHEREGVPEDRHGSGRVAHRLQRVHRHHDHHLGCSNGDTHHHYRNTILTSPIALTEVYNGSADKVTDWTLGAKGASVISEDNTGGTRFPNWNTDLPTGRLLGLLRYNVAQSHSDVTSFMFNGTPVSIVVNPYVAPAV